jgi:hypothetical protein
MLSFCGLDVAVQIVARKEAQCNMAQPLAENYIFREFWMRKDSFIPSQMSRRNDQARECQPQHHISLPVHCGISVAYGAASEG